ncbi:hypothetical protein MRB53_039672 [Persea americana]|nr:hypothetical protein MRB53_039672 [Persea americana]
MQTDGSSSLAPDRSTSLRSQNRPVTSGSSYYHISSTVPSPMNTRSNRSSYHPPSTYRNHEWDLLKQKETSQLTVPDDGRCVRDTIPLNSAPTTGRPQRTHARRGSISESIKNGISSVRSLGRRMSLSMKTKRSNTTDDRLLVPDMISPIRKEQIQLYERPETISSTSNRPKSIIEGLRARRRPSMPIIKYSPRLDDAQSQAVSRTDSCRTESFHRAATMPQRPEYPTGGAGARASAAAQNEALQLARATPLPPYRPRSGSFEEFTEYRDSESGIGIMVYSGRTIRLENKFCVSI